MPVGLPAALRKKAICDLDAAAKESRNALRPPQTHPRVGKVGTTGPCGANDEFLLAATAQNLRKLAKIFPAPQQTQKARSEWRLRDVRTVTFCASNTLFFHRMWRKPVIRCGCQIFALQGRKRTFAASACFEGQQYENRTSQPGHPKRTVCLLKCSLPISQQLHHLLLRTKTIHWLISDCQLCSAFQ